MLINILHFFTATKAWILFCLLFTFFSPFKSTSQPSDLLSVEMTTTNATCGYDNGQAIIEVTGNDGNYTIIWSNGESNTDLITDLSIGNYSVTVTDQSEQIIVHGSVNQAEGPKLLWSQNYGGSGKDEIFDIEIIKYTNRDFPKSNIE